MHAVLTRTMTGAVHERLRAEGQLSQSSLYDRLLR